tara:strand:- start:1567 stop:1803 length:237 start_codon:yes stop_codon:yes gene_type:complete
MLEKIKETWTWILSKTSLDEKAKEIITIADKRLTEVKKESKDVVKAAKKVKTELKDVVDAIAGKEVKAKKKKSSAKKK